MGNIFNKKEVRKSSLFFLFLLFYFIVATNVLASCYDDLEVSVKKHEYNKDMIKFTFLNNSNKEIAIDEYGIKTLDDQIIKSIVKNIYDDNKLKGFIYLSINGYGKLLEYISLSDVNPKIEKKYYYKCRYSGSIENLK